MLRTILGYPGSVHYGMRLLASPGWRVRGGVALASGRRGELSRLAPKVGIACCPAERCWRRTMWVAASASAILGRWRNQCRVRAERFLLRHMEVIVERVD